MTISSCLKCRIGSIESEINIMKRLYVVTDAEKEDYQCYCYVVLADDYKDAIKIVKK